jgi:hypothetical protein
MDTGYIMSDPVPPNPDRCSTISPRGSGSGGLSPSAYLDCVLTVLDASADARLSLGQYARR